MRFNLPKVATLALPMLLAGMAPISLMPVSASAQAAAPRAADSITKADIGSTVTVAGKVGVFTPSPAPNVPFTLKLGPEGSSAVAIVFWTDLKSAILGGADTVPVGTSVTITGQVSQYRDALQIRVRDAKAIQIEGFPKGGAPAAAAAAADQPGAAPAVLDGGYLTEANLPLPAALIGQELNLKAPILEFRASWSETAPNVITVGKGETKLEIVYWDKEKQVAPFSEVGKTIHVSGKLGMHREKMQLRVDDLSRLSYDPLAADKLAGPEAAAAAAPAAKGWSGAGAKAAITIPAEGDLTAAAQLAAAAEGRTVVITGSVFSVRPGQTDVVALLKDPTGLATVRIAAAPSAVPPAFTEGSMWTVKGVVKMNAERSQPEVIATSVSPAAQ